MVLAGPTRRIIHDSFCGPTVDYIVGFRLHAIKFGILAGPDHWDFRTVRLRADPSSEPPDYQAS